MNKNIATTAVIAIGALALSGCSTLTASTRDDVVSPKPPTLTQVQRQSRTSTTPRTSRWLKSQGHSEEPLGH